MREPVKMASTNQSSSTTTRTQHDAIDGDDDDEQEDDQEEYIDMEVSSSNSSASVSASVSSQNSTTREFEFQMSTSLSHDREAITSSPADELFYKGKLLPLHLPPRILMVQNLLQNNNNVGFDRKVNEESFEEGYAIPFLAAGPGAARTPPVETGYISPAESCRASSELNPDEYFFEWSSEANGFIGEVPRKYHSWYKKLKQIKQSHLGQKIKASRTYLKSLFSKSGCSDDSCAKAACNGEAEGSVSKGGKYCLNRYVKVGKRSPFGQIDNDRYKISDALMKSIDKEIAVVEDGVNSQRRSFSGAIKWHSAAKCLSSSTTSSTSSSSSSFSFSSSNGYYDLHLLKRSNSANSELESSIEGAIAHCKQSSSCVVQERLPVK